MISSRAGALEASAAQATAPAKAAVMPRMREMAREGTV